VGFSDNGFPVDGFSVIGFPDNGEPNGGKRCIAERLQRDSIKRWKIGLYLRPVSFCWLNGKTYSQHFKRRLQTKKSPYFNPYYDT